MNLKLVTHQSYLASLRLIPYLIALIFNACASVPPPKVYIKNIKHLGGSFTAVCVTPNEIHLKSYYRFLSLKYQDLGLKLKEQSRLLHTSSKLNLRTNGTPLDLNDKKKTQTSIHLNDHDPCPQVEAWVQLNPKSRLSMRWHEQSLVVSPRQWRWGAEQRDQLTKLWDISPVSFGHKNKDQRYLISSQHGLWAWKYSQRNARKLVLPKELPQNIISIAKDQDAWWLDTSVGDIQQIWPISFMSGQAKLISSPIKQNTSIKSQILLAPLSGVALRGKVDGLELKWGQQSYPFQTLQSLCVLSKRMVAVATKSELMILLGPQPAKANPASSKPQLSIIKSINLPTKTRKLLCEDQRIFALGEGYGLLSLELTIVEEPKHLDTKIKSSN